MIKGIVFDKDGTLLEYKPFWLEVGKNAAAIILKKYGIGSEYVDSLLRSLGAYDGISAVFYYGTYQDFADKFNAVLTEMGKGDIVITREEIAEAFRNSVPCGKILPTCKNITEIFKKIKEKGIKTAVVTTDEPEITAYCLDALKIHSYIDVVYADDGINPTKPNPYYLHSFCRKFWIQPSEILMVGDTPLDMEFAKNSGVTAVGVARDRSDKKILKKYTDVVIDDISKIFNVLEDGQVAV